MGQNDPTDGRNLPENQGQPPDRNPPAGTNPLQDQNAPATANPLGSTNPPATPPRTEEGQTQNQKAANDQLGDFGNSITLTPEQYVQCWEKIEPLLLNWSIRSHDHQLTQYEASHVYKTYSIWLGLPVVVLTTIVGSGIFATYSNSNSTVELVLGGLSVVSTSLAAVQSFLRYSEAAADHRIAAIQFGMVRRDIDAELAIPAEFRMEPRRFLRNIASRLDAIDNSAPSVPNRIFDRLQRLKAARTGKIGAPQPPKTQ